MLSSMPPIDRPSARLGSRKKIPATTSSTSRLAVIIAMASRQASLMSNFTCLSPDRRTALDKLDSSRQQMTSMTQADGSVSGILEWRQDHAPVPYRASLAEQEARNAAIAAGTARELIWLLERPPIYTAGTSADPDELLDARFEVVEPG